MNDFIFVAIFLLLFTLSLVIGPIIKWWLEKNKFEAETESIKLKNKITKDITYHQLKGESKRKNISGNVKIFQELLDLEKRIEAEKNLIEKEKRLKSLEKLKDSFQENISDNANEEILKLEAKKKKKLTTTNIN